MNKPVVKKANIAACAFNPAAAAWAAANAALIIAACGGIASTAA